MTSHAEKSQFGFFTKQIGHQRLLPLQV